MHRRSLFFTTLLLALWALSIGSRAHAAMGEFTGFTLTLSKDQDALGKGSARSPDKKPDALFKALLSGNGVALHFSLRNVTTGQLWSTDPRYKSPLLLVRNSEGKTLNTADGMSALAFVGRTPITLLVNDRASLIASGGELHLIAHFVDKSTATGVLKLPDTKAQKTAAAPAIEATLIGPASRDLVGNTSERFAPNKKNDWLVLAKMRTEGELTHLKIVNVSGDLGTWDTSKDSGSPFIGVTLPSGATVNSDDGTLAHPLKGETTLFLWIEDNGTLGNANTRSKLIATVDGKKIESLVSPIPARYLAPAKIISAKYLGTSDYDFVGMGKKLTGDGSPDSIFEIQLQGQGVLTAVRLSDKKDSSRTWDTVPESGNALVGVSGQDYVLLNKDDGSVSAPLHIQKRLLLWVQGKGTMAPATYRVSLSFADGHNHDFEFKVEK